MSAIPVEHHEHAFSPKEEQLSGQTSSLGQLLLSWETYLIVLVAGWLRLYGIDTTEFDDDQAAVFRMAHDAVSHHLLVATSNIASIHIYNPPAIIYFFMIPAAFSANPLWGSVMVGVLMTLSVLLTYVFVRRYYGRIAATVAALLYAVAARPVFYSRFIWNQNLLPILTVLLLFTLFRGVVERKKAWLAPAIFLVGILIQLHATGIMMAFPLAIALLLSPKTLRWLDLPLGIGALFISYLPYFLWEVSTNYIDIHTLLTVTKQPIFIDDKAWLYYQLFLSPYDYSNLPAKNTLLGSVVPYLGWTLDVMMVFVVGGAIIALLSLFWHRSMQAGVNDDEHAKKRVWSSVIAPFSRFRADTYRCGLLVLLIWQIVPQLLLIRHSIGLYPHYIIILMPGPFIFAGLFVKEMSQWCKTKWKWTVLLRYALYIVAALLIVAQGVGSTASTLDSIFGNFNDTVLSHPYYSDLHSLQNALMEADYVAQQFHYGRVYISYDAATEASLRYLSQQIHTPTTLFDSSSCVVLPGSGPAVMLIGPYSPFTEALVRHFASATLVATPQRLSGPPFKLYIVRPPTEQSVDASFGNNLQLLGSHVPTFTYNGGSWFVTQWRLLHSAQPSYQKLYGYVISTYANASATNAMALNKCNMTSMQNGDILLSSFAQNGNHNVPVDLKVQAYTVDPYTLNYGALSFETYRNIETPLRYLQTQTGAYALAVSIK